VVEFIGPLGRGNGNFGKKVSNFWGMMQTWADYLDKLAKGGNVIELRAA